MLLLTTQRGELTARSGSAASNGSSSCADFTTGRRRGAGLAGSSKGSGVDRIGARRARGAFGMMSGIAAVGSRWNGESLDEAGG